MRSAGLRCALLLTLGPATSHAGQALPLELQWHAPAPCPSLQEVRAHLERTLVVSESRNLPKLRAQARVERHAGTYVLVLHTERDGLSGERQLRASRCDTLVRSLALTLALAFGTAAEMTDDTRVGAGREEDKPADNEAGSEAASHGASDVSAHRASLGSAEAKPHSAAPTSPTEPTPIAREATTPGARASTSNRAATAGSASGTSPAGRRHTDGLWVPSLGAGLRAGMLPQPAWGWLAGLDWQHDRWSVAFRAGLWPSQTTTVTSDVQARFESRSSELSACSRWTPRRLALLLCGGAQAATAGGRAQGTLLDQSATAAWFALSGGAAVAWPRSSWVALRSEAGLAASLKRPRFAILGFRDVHRVAPVVADLRLLLSVEL